MALADETDPREAVRLLLDDNAADADYSNAGSKPGTIEVVEDSPRKKKRTFASDALYIWTPGDTPVEKFAAGGSDRTETAGVQVECWTKTSDTQAHNLKEDVVSIVGAKADDSQQTTAFVDIFPTTISDIRHEQRTLKGNQYVEAVLVLCRRFDSV